MVNPGKGGQARVTPGLSAHTHKAAMAVISRQGAAQHIDASPTRIARMLTEVFRHERDIRAWEDMKSSKGRRLVRTEDGKLVRKPVAELVGDSLDKARAARDEHIEDIRQVIDYALTEDLYEVIPCPACKLPADALAFADKVTDWAPTSDCSKCEGSGRSRVKKSDETSKKAYKRISYFKRVLDDVIDCAKVRHGTSDRHEAYARLEAKNRNLLVKFGNEKQTSVEGADAEQGARMGIIDAARRFDPTLPNMASFNTVAYNWSYRNSRARHDWQKRAGVYAPSVEAMGTDEDGNGMSAMIVNSAGALGVLGGSSTSQPMGGSDRCRKCGDLSELDPETWAPTGYCEPCSKFAKPKKAPTGPTPGDLYDGGGSVSSVPQSVKLDIRDAIGELEEEERTVVTLEMAGSSVAQISRETGISTVKVRRLRKAAFEKLREGLVGYALRE